MIIECIECGKKNEAIRANRKFCSDKCSFRSRNPIKERMCSECGKPFTSEKKSNYCSDECRKEYRRKENRDSYRKFNPGWNSGIDKICETCGKDFIDKSNTKHARFCSGECRDRSRHLTMDEFIEKRRIESEESKPQREVIAQRKKMIESAERRFFSYRALKCKVCGEMFGTHQPNQVTCSPECSKKRRSQHNDKRLNKGNIVDRDITLATLYKRDKGICYICGDETDWEDYTKGPGYVTVGITYPTIDHLIPLSRGGKHSWDNIRLAHHHCNSVKSDTVPENVNEIIPEDAYVLARKVSPRSKQASKAIHNGWTIDSNV